MKQYYTSFFAQAYGEGSYGACVYNNSTQCTTSSGSSGSGNVLTNTGFDIAAVVTIACVLIFTALVVRIWRKPSRQQTAEPVIVDDDQDEQHQDDSSQNDSMNQQ